MSVIISFKICSPVKSLTILLAASESFATHGPVEDFAFPGPKSREDLKSVTYVYPSFREARNFENLVNVVSTQDWGEV